MLMLAYLFSILAAGVLVLAHPYVIVRPSVWFCLLMILRINGAAAFGPEEIFCGYQELWTLRLLSICFPLAIMVWVVCTPGLNSAAQNLYRKCRATAILPAASVYGAPERRALLVFGVAVVITLAAYLTTVRITKTGLWATLFHPATYTMAREESLKLVASPFVRYMYNWHCVLFAPIVIGLLASGGRWRLNVATICRGSIILMLILSVMLTGARAPGAVLFMLLAILYMLRKGVIKGGIVVFLTACCAIFLAMLLTFMRAGRLDELSPESATKALSGGLFGRVFVSPFRTGVWTNLYAQEHGLLGVSNIRPLALLCGTKYVNLANRVALAYIPGVVRSCHSNTCFLFAFQASFGLLPGFVVALVGLCCLDFLLFGFKRLNGSLLVVMLASFMVALLSLNSGAFTVCLNTHGLLWIPVLAWMFALTNRRALRRRYPWSIQRHRDDLE